MLLYIIVSLIIGALLCYFVISVIQKRKMTNLTDEINRMRIERSAMEQKLSYSESELNRSKDELEQTDADLKNYRSQLNETQANLRVAEGKVATLKEGMEEFKSAKTKDLEEAKKDYDAKVETLKLMFKEEAAKILKQSSKDLSDSNSEQMKNIIDPLAKDMEAFKKAVDDSKESSNKNTVTIEQQIKSMMEHTEKISKDANNLTEALRTKNKIVGNWGEVILENSLRNIGLREGIDYDLQVMLKDANGNPITLNEEDKKLIPDAIVYLPDNKAIVVDSKVSLKSFIDYTAEENPDKKEGFLKDYVASVHAHIKELAAKKYGEYMKLSGKDALSYVIMFIPSENAFQLFFQKYLDKWHSAFDEGVIVTGEANLFAMLKIVQVVWSQHKQQKEIDNIVKISGELLERVGRFVRHFNDVGKSLENAQDKFSNAQKALSGRQSIKTTSNKLAKMGVDVPELLLNQGDDIPLINESSNIK